MAGRAGIVTAEELRRMPDEGVRRELVRGERRVMPLAGAEHGRVAMTVSGLLWRHVDQNALGAGFATGTGFMLARDPDTVLAPDAAFVTKERDEEVGTTDDYWASAPDLAAKVVGPDDTFSEVEGKVLMWLQAGTKAVLVLDPERWTATTYRGRGEVRVHTDQETIDLSDAVPGWRVTVSELIA